MFLRPVSIPAKKFSIHYKRKNWPSANQKRRENFFAGWRASANGDGAERQMLRSKNVRADLNESEPFSPFAAARKPPAKNEWLRRKPDYFKFSKDFTSSLC